jgi:hypothetical protein
LSCLSACAEQSSEITILTDEGDTVLLSSRQHAEAALITYEHLSWTRHGYIQEEIQRIDFENEHEVALAVEGDLNDQEIEDIQALLNELGGMLKAFLSGEAEGEPSLEALEAEGRLEGFASLSAVKADFEYRVSLQYMHSEVERLAFRDAGGPEPWVSAGPETTTPAVRVLSSAPDPAEAAADRTAAELGTRRVEIEGVAAKMARRVHAAGQPGDRRVKHFRNFLKNLLKELLASGVIDAAQDRRGRSVIEQFINRLQAPVGAVELQARRGPLNRYEATGPHGKAAILSETC